MRFDTSPLIFTRLLATVALVLLAGLLAAAAVPLHAQTTIYVDADATAGANDGTSWTDAYTDLQDALTNAASGDQIWVAEGVYYPDEGGGQTDNDRSATFQLINGVEIYGGFAGGESTPGERDVAANPTILSGDIDGNDAPFDPETDSDGDPGTPAQTDHIVGDNSFHVVTGNGTDGTAQLDGFTLTAGLANEVGFPNDRGAGMSNNGGSPTLANLAFSGNDAFVGAGGGMYNENNSSPVLTSIIFSDNSGGGMFNLNSGSPVLTNVIFSGNSAGNNGGGMWNSDSSPELTNVTFAGNISGAIGGGMYSVDFSSPTLTNVTFAGNSAGTGGGMANINSNPLLTNVTFSGNNAVGSGGGMFNLNNSGAGNPTLTNVVIWGNQAGGSTTSTSASIFNNDEDASPVIAYSLIANSGGSGAWNDTIGTDGGNNIDADPLFVAPVDPNDAPTTAGNLRLTDGSPAIDAGDPGTDPLIFPTDEEGNPVDLDGHTRFFPDETAIDMGTYEWPSGLAPSTVGGWRLLTVPGGGLTVGSLAAMNLVQGVEGSYPAADPNLYVDWFGPAEQHYTPAASLDEALQPGRGFYWYLFDEADFGGNAPPPEWTDIESFVFTLIGDELTADTEVAFDAIPTTEPDSLPAYMIGNPYQAAFQLSGIGVDEGMLQTNFFAWDPENISYLALGPDDYVSPWQGLFAEVDAGASAPTFSFDYDSVNPSETPPIVGVRSDQTFALNLSLHGTLDGGSEVADLANKLRFEEDAMLAWDRHDGSKFMPPACAACAAGRPLTSSSYALLSPEGIRNEQPMRQSVRSLPSGLDEAVTVPVAFLATEAGDFTISATPENLPEGLEISLLDLATEEETNLLEDAYSFSGEANEDWQDRFEVTVTPAGVIGTEGDPLEFHLSNAFPNPASASTSLSLRVPDAQHVTARVYDALGRLVSTAHDGSLAAGEEVRLEIDTASLAAGAYVVRVEGESFAETRRFTVVR